MEKQMQVTGKRKTAVAQLLLTRNKQNQGQILIASGSCKRKIRHLTLEAYFLNQALIKLIHKPILLTRTTGNYDITVKLKGGGLAGQAGALSAALAKFLAQLSQDYHALLKAAKLLTRDARIKERKKYGLKKARKAPQFSKR